jgi:hypothetical protein
MFANPLTPLAKAIVAIVGLIIVIAAFWLAMHFYGVHRYNEGVSAEDAKWATAVAQLKSDASNAANNADANAAANLANFVQQHSADENAVNAAEANGSSPLDALFGN